MNTLLESKQLQKRYLLGKNNEQHVLKDVNLHIERGEFVSVMGPSGSGKSTLLYNISGMDRMTSGSVIFNDQELSALSEKELSNVRLNSMGFIFQHIHQVIKGTQFLLERLVSFGYKVKILVH